MRPTTLPIALLLLLLPALLPAQKTSSWRDHFDYSQGVAALDVQGQTVYAATAGLVFNEENGHISKSSGLSDFGLSAACYDPRTASIYVGYSNGNLDVLHSIEPRKIRNGGYTKNIVAWKNFVTHGRKAITCFLRVGDRMLVGTASQILEVKNDEILANYSIDERNDSLAIIRLALVGDSIAALTSKGVYAIHQDNAQRYYYPSWRKSALVVPPPPAPPAVPNAPASPHGNQTLALDEHNGTVVAVTNGALSVMAPKGAWKSLAHAGFAGASEAKVNPKNPAQIFVATSSGVAEASVGDAALAFAGKGLSGANVGTMSCDKGGNLFAFASRSATPVHLR
ncbi:MAG: hypothetical protein LBS94_05510, partial [Prevotellaceae bacterium]|nr:hypothetical protein [Prevotellaceae bacterium]